MNHPATSRLLWGIILLAALLLPGHGLIWNNGHPHEPTTPLFIRAIRDLIFIAALPFLTMLLWRNADVIQRHGWKSLSMGLAIITGLIALGVLHIFAGKDAWEVAQHEWRNPFLYALVVPLSATLFLWTPVKTKTLIFCGVALLSWFITIGWIFPLHTTEQNRLIGHFERGPNLSFVVFCLGVWSIGFIHSVSRPFIFLWSMSAVTCLLLAGSFAGYLTAAFTPILFVFAPIRRRITNSLAPISAGIIVGIALALLFPDSPIIKAKERIEDKYRSNQEFAITHSNSNINTCQSSYNNASKDVSQLEGSSFASRILQHRMVLNQLTGNGWFSSVEILFGDLNTTHYYKFDSQYLNVAYNFGLVGLALLALFLVWVFTLIRAAWLHTPSSRDEILLLTFAMAVIVGPYWLTAAFQQRYPMNLLFFILVSRLWWLAYHNPTAVNNLCRHPSI